MGSENGKEAAGVEPSVLASAPVRIHLAEQCSRASVLVQAPPAQPPPPSAPVMPPPPVREFREPELDIGAPRVFAKSSRRVAQIPPAARAVTDRGTFFPSTSPAPPFSSAALPRFEGQRRAQLSSP